MVIVFGLLNLDLKNYLTRFSIMSLSTFAVSGSIAFAQGIQPTVPKIETPLTTEDLISLCQQAIDLENNIREKIESLQEKHLSVFTALSDACMRPDIQLPEDSRFTLQTLGLVDDKGHPHTYVRHIVLEGEPLNAVGTVAHRTLKSTSNSR